MQQLTLVLDGTLLPLEMNLRPPGGITVGIHIFWLVIVFFSFDYPNIYGIMHTE